MVKLFHIPLLLPFTVGRSRKMICFLSCCSFERTSGGHLSFSFIPLFRRAKDREGRGREEMNASLLPFIFSSLVVFTAPPQGRGGGKMFPEKKREEGKREKSSAMITTMFFFGRPSALKRKGGKKGAKRRGGERGGNCINYRTNILLYNFTSQNRAREKRRFGKKEGKRKVVLSTASAPPKFRSLLRMSGGKKGKGRGLKKGRGGEGVLPHSLIASFFFPTSATKTGKKGLPGGKPKGGGEEEEGKRLKAHSLLRTERGEKRGGPGCMQALSTLPR